MKTREIESFCDQVWENRIIPELINYIRIPNKSPMFDANWQKNGYMDQVVEQFVSWCHSQEISGLQLEVVRLPERTPLIYMDIPGQSDNTVLLYGHLDKQPEMSGWRDGLGPWEPVMDGDKLYGRGGADDGYATFSSLLAIKALQEQNIPHARCVVIIEACEESGSYDLPFYIDHLANRIGQPELVICLDSGCGNYDQLWNTTSLRGLIGGDLKIEVLKEGVHSGDASGIVSSSFRILRQLLDRIDDPKTGFVLADEFNVGIPESRIKQARLASKVLGETVFSKFPFIDDTKPILDDGSELILNRTWRPALSITGADGLPLIENAGNVLRPMTAVKISLRLPPTCDAEKASAKLKTLLESDPPYQSRITFTPDWAASGWHAPEMAAWLENAINEASLNYFDKPAMHMGEGGTIPFIM